MDTGIPRKIVIYGYQDTPAEAYAKLYGCKFVLLDESNYLNNKNFKIKILKQVIKKVERQN